MVEHWVTGEAAPYQGLFGDVVVDHVVEERPAVQQFDGVLRFVGCGLALHLHHMWETDDRPDVSFCSSLLDLPPAPEVPD